MDDDGRAVFGKADVEFDGVRAEFHAFLEAFEGVLGLVRFCAAVADEEHACLEAIA